ncbi:Ion transport protein [Popillia japonica]|uniref:Ion transport protein n=1 Tax=Popillia japonica TaxID=7064 RepID=A0AAW1N2A5_POPJA
MLIKLDHSIRISVDNPRSHLFYRTNTAILLEREKHKKSDFAHVIHPFSSFRVYWEMFMMLVFLLYLIITPVIIAFFQMVRLPKAVLILDGTFDFICIIDICLTFITGYAIDHTKEVVLNRRNITANYLLSIYFVLDVISSIPTEMILLFVWLLGWDTQALMKYVQLANLLKVIRTRTLMTYMSRAA